MGASLQHRGLKPMALRPATVPQRPANKYLISRLTLNMAKSQSELIQKKTQNIWQPANAFELLFLYQSVSFKGQRKVDIIYKAFQGQWDYFCPLHRAIHLIWKSEVSDPKECNPSWHHSAKQVDQFREYCGAEQTEQAAQLQKGLSTQQNLSQKGIKEFVHTEGFNIHLPQSKCGPASLSSRALRCLTARKAECAI